MISRTSLRLDENGGASTHASLVSTGLFEDRAAGNSQLEIAVESLKGSGF